MKKWFLVWILAVSTTAHASTFSRILFGQDVERQYPVGTVVFDYDGQQDEKGTLIPGGSLNARLVMDDDLVKGLPYTFGYLSPSSSRQADAVAVTGLYKNSIVLEQVTVKDIERKREKKNGGLFSREYEIRNMVSGNYVFFVTSLPYGRNKPMMASCVVNVGRENVVKSKVTRRITEYALDKDGKEVEEVVEAPAVKQKAEHGHSPRPEIIREQTLSHEAQVRVTKGFVNVFGPAGMPVTIQVNGKNIAGAGGKIKENGRLTFSGIPIIPAGSYVSVLFSPDGMGWKEAGTVSLSSEKPVASMSIDMENRTWLTDEEMNRYLNLIDRLDRKQGTAVGQIERQRVARGEWIYWVQKPQPTTDEDWKYLSSVREPRRRQQLLEMLSRDVIHRGNEAFPADKTLTAGWGYELAYQVLTYMKPQWAVRDGAKFYVFIAPPNVLPDVVIAPHVIAQNVAHEEHHTIVAPTSQLKPRTRVIVEEVEVEGWTSGAVRPEGLAQSTTIRYHKPGLWDKIVQPLSAYVGRTRMSISTSATGGNVGDVNNSNANTNSQTNSQTNTNSAEGGDVGDIDVSADAAASSAADAAAAAESN